MVIKCREVFPSASALKAEQTKSFQPLFVPCNQVPHRAVGPLMISSSVPKSFLPWGAQNCMELPRCTLREKRVQIAQRSSIKLLAMLWLIQPATQLVFFAARAHWPLMFQVLPSWSPGPSVHRCFPAGLLGMIIQQLSGSAWHLNYISQILWHLHLFLMALQKSKFTGRDQKKM